MALQTIADKVTDAEIAEVVRAQAVRRLMRFALKAARLDEDPRDGPPPGYFALSDLVRRLDGEER